MKVSTVALSLGAAVASALLLHAEPAAGAVPARLRQIAAIEHQVPVQVVEQAVARGWKKPVIDKKAPIEPAVSLAEAKQAADATFAKKQKKSSTAHAPTGGADRGHGANSDAKTSAKSDAKTSVKTSAKSDDKSIAKINANSDAKTSANSDAKTSSKTSAESDVKSSAKSDTKSSPKSDTKSDTKSSPKSDTKSSTKNIAKSIAKGVSKTGTKSSAKSDSNAKAEEKANAHTAAKQEKSKADAAKTEKARAPPKLASHGAPQGKPSPEKVSAIKRSDPVANDHAYSELQIGAEARAAGASVMTQMAESFRDEANKSLAFLGAVAGLVVGVVVVIVALVALNRQHSEFTVVELESDLSDIESGRIQDVRVAEQEAAADGGAASEAAADDEEDAALSSDDDGADGAETDDDDDDEADGERDIESSTVSV